MIHISDRLHEDLSASDISELNKYHKHPSKEAKYQNIRDACNILMIALQDNCPRCKDREEAIKTVRLTRMWANSAIALDEVSE